MLKEICWLSCRPIPVKFCPKNPDIRKNVVLFFFWSFQVLSACTCDKSSMTLEHWWSNTDEGNPKY